MLVIITKSMIIETIQTIRSNRYPLFRKGAHGSCAWCAHIVRWIGKVLPAIKAKWQIASMLAVLLTAGVPIACKAQDILVVERYVGELTTAHYDCHVGATPQVTREQIVIHDPTLTVAAGCTLGSRKLYQTFSGVYRVSAYWFGDFTNPPPVEKIKLKINEEVSATALMGWARATSLNISAYASCPYCIATDRRSTSKQEVIELGWAYVYQDGGGYWEAKIEIPLTLRAITPEAPRAGAAWATITIEPLTKFILIRSSVDPTYRKGYDPQGNVIRELNSPGEGDTVIDWQWCNLIFTSKGPFSSIIYNLEFYPSAQAWNYDRWFNPDINWSYTLGEEGYASSPLRTSLFVFHGFCSREPKLPFTDSISATARDRVDGFEDSATYEMRIHNEIEKYKLLRQREFDWSEGAVIAAMLNARREDTTWHVTVSKTSSFTWETQVTGSFTVSPESMGLEFGTEVSYSTSESYSCGMETGVTMTLRPGELGIFLVRPVGYREAWLCDVYDKQGFVGETTVCHSAPPPSAAPPFVPIVFTRMNSSLEAFTQEMAARRANLWCATQMTYPVPCGR